MAYYINLEKINFQSQKVTTAKGCVPFLPIHFFLAATENPSLDFERCSPFEESQKMAKKAMWYLLEISEEIKDGLL